MRFVSKRGLQSEGRGWTLHGAIALNDADCKRPPSAGRVEPGCGGRRVIEHPLKLSP